jgi:putative ABC transport system permease protein
LTRSFITQAFGAAALVAATHVGLAQPQISLTLDTYAHGLGQLKRAAADLIRLVVTDAMTVTLTGLAMGLVLALAAVRATSAFLISIPGIDSVSVICIPVLLVGVTGAACYVPGRRAARVDPMVAIREL